MELKIATCQFPVGGDPLVNRQFVLRQLTEAARRGAHVAHFSETALSGYVGVDLPSLDDYPWAALESAMRDVMALARKLRIWVVLGSMHWLEGKHKPHNCVYVIDDRGRLVDRYDKLFCTGNRAATKGDLKYFTPGDHFVVFKLRGYRCGVLICHDFRYPEVYREYGRRKVEIVFHSYHNGHFPLEKARTKGRRMSVIVPATMQASASVNHLWISAANTSRRYSAWGVFAVQPDGMLAGRLRPHQAGVLLTEVKSTTHYEDASRFWRDRALRGILHSGKTVRDARSRDRRTL
jgi:predicted amidohydrolase